MIKKILHCADLHLGSSLQYGHIDQKSGQWTRFLDYLRTFDAIVNRAISEKPVDVFVFAGDAFRSRNPSMTQQREFARRIKRLTQAGIPVVLLIGNHDLCNDPNKATSLEIFEILGDEKLVHVSSRPELFELNGIQFATLPWFTRSAALTLPEFSGKNKEEVNKDLGEIATKLLSGLIAQASEEKPLVVVAHATVSGAKYGQERDVMIGQDVVIPHTAFVDKKVSYAALGHIHRHQTVGENHIVYSGSPECVDFGEEGQVKGFVIAGVEAGKRADWKFIPLITRPFYSHVFTEGSAEGEVSFDDWTDAVVKIKVEGSSASLKKFDFEKLENQVKAACPHWYSISKSVKKEVREQAKQASRYSELSTLALIDEFLKKKKLKEALRSRIVHTSAGLISRIDPDEAVSSGHGGFIPDKLTLRNYTSHEHSELDFSKFALAVLSGENGSGKSSLVEALAWAIWGESRAKSDDSLIRQGSSDMEVEFEFSLGLNSFRILRKRSMKGSRGTTILELQSVNDGTYHTLTGDSIRGTQEMITNLVGMSYEVFSNSVFLRQGMAGAFSEAAPAHRKEILSEILSLGIWNKMQDIAKIEKKESEGKCEVFSMKKEHLMAEILREEERSTDLALAKEALATARVDLEVIQSEYERVENETRQVVVNKSKKEMYETSLARDRARLAEIKRTLSECESTEVSSMKIMERKDEIEAAAEKVKNLEIEIRQIQRIKDRYNEALRNKQKQELVLANYEFEKRRSQDGIKNLEERKNQIAERGKLLNQKQSEAGIDCPACGASPEHQKKSPHTEIGNEILSLRKEWQNLDEIQKANVAQLNNMTPPLSEEITLPTFSETMLAEKEESLSSARGIADLLPQLEAAQDRIHSARETATNLITEELNLVSEIDEYERIVQAIPVVDEKMIQYVADCKHGVQSQQDIVSQKQSLVAIAETKVVFIDQQKIELKKLEEENHETVEERIVWDEIVSACGRNGIQAMIIDSVLPEIEDEANRILSQISAGRMSVRMSTQREKKSAKKDDTSLIETLDIYVTDESGEREYEMYSGGEAFRVNFALRIALSKVLAHRAGTQVRFLLIDEGFGVLDEDGRSAFIGAVQSVGTEFEKVIAISHIDEIRDSFETKILVEKIDQKSHVTILS